MPFHPCSLGNPFVHSLLVTLGNHAIHPLQPYNCSCSNRPLSKEEFGQLTFPRAALPGTVKTFSKVFQCRLCGSHQGLEFVLLWRSVSGSTNKKFSALRRSMSSRARFRTPSLNTKK